MLEWPGLVVACRVFWHGLLSCNGTITGPSSWHCSDRQPCCHQDKAGPQCLKFPPLQLTLHVPVRLKFAPRWFSALCQELHFCIYVDNALQCVIRSGWACRCSAAVQHSGLGSGTQMALAIGMAICDFYRLDLNVNEIAVLTQRGARSGIGLGTFAQGGFIVDGGRAAESKVPPVIARADFPEDWPILLIFDIFF